MAHVRRPPNPRELLAEAGIGPKKSWGQNFLCDQGALREIAQATEAEQESLVVELGAGLGALTFHLLELGCTVVAIERDRELVPALRRTFSNEERLRIEEADATKVDFSSLAREHGKKIIVAGNLPYQVASRIIVNIADAHDHVSRAVLLVQREVAQRLAAPPGSRTYGLLSVLVQRAFDVRLVRAVRPGAFFPPPKVHSAVVRLCRQERGWTRTQHQHVVAAARAAFSARRKTLRNALGGALQAAPGEIEEALVSFRIDPKRRAESLSIDDFVNLSEALAARGLLPTE